MTRSIIRFERVSKRFTLHHERAFSFQELAINLLQGRGRNPGEEFWALRDIDFEVQQGEMVGIIGVNGSGKSTLLKLTARIIEPTSGHITVSGRVAALLELGAGFHPDLTGQENIYLNGSILGLTRREIDNRFQEIVSFAELERFIDIPVRHYSSGMYVRLGFAIAVHVEPDILLIDETLAVGDRSFQRKCLERIYELKQRGITILFVSHDLEAVRQLCNRAIWLDEGVMRAEGSTERVIGHYLDYDIALKETRSRQEDKERPRKNRWGSGEVEVLAVNFLDAQGNERRVFETGERMIARINYCAHHRVERPVFGVAIHRHDGLHINGPNTKLSGYDIDYVEGKGEIDYIIETLPLLEGRYEFTVGIYDHSCLHPYDHQERAYRFTVRQGDVQEGYGALYIPCRWEHRSQ